MTDDDTGTGIVPNWEREPWDRPAYPPGRWFFPRHAWDHPYIPQITMLTAGLFVAAVFVLTIWLGT